LAANSHNAPSLVITHVQIITNLTSQVDHSTRDNRAYRHGIFV